jgi:hypothetical protein
MIYPNLVNHVTLYSAFRNEISDSTLYGEEFKYHYFSKKEYHRKPKNIKQTKPPKYNMFP